MKTVKIEDRAIYTVYEINLLDYRIFEFGIVENSNSCRNISNFYFLNWFFAAEETFRRFRDSCKIPVTKNSFNDSK
jgi:hypothetical protein